MIINHQHRFCFYAIPRTASKAITSVLLDAFESEEILRMHSGYEEFMQIATPEEQQFFSFATVRNPLDSVVSAYFKKKTNHNGRFSRGTFGNGRPIGGRAMEEYRFITLGGTFADYFLEFYTEPYQLRRHERTLDAVDQIIRYEELQHGFDGVLNQLGLPNKQIPLRNKTAARAVHYITYYTPLTHERAEKVFGPIMQKWGYEFPDW